MYDSLLLNEFAGELRVVIRGVGEFTPNFHPEIIGHIPTLFEYVGHAYACLTTDLKKKLAVYTKSDDWEVLRFSPEERVLEVRMINPECGSDGYIIARPPDVTIH